ncbi:MAG: hypothetical protein WD022_11870 [Balneolaceae bacterium]
MSFKYLLLSLITVIASQQVYAQNFEAEIAVGYSSYATKDLIRFQDEIISGNRLSFKTTDRFPAQPYLQITVAKIMGDGNRVGFFWGYLSTGGRLTVSDYSGEVSSDQILINHELGVNLNLYIEDLKSEKIAPFFQMKISALLSRLELFDQAHLSNGESYKEELTLIAQNASITPSIGLDTNIISTPLRVTVGYLIQVTEFPFHLRENRDAKLRISGDNTVGPGLTGLRVSVSGVLSF